MEQVFMFFFSHFIWLIFIAVVLGNSVHFLFQGQKYIKEDPTLKQGYYRIAFGFGFFFSIPFLIGWLGAVFGGMEILNDYFILDLENPYNLAWWASIAVLDIVLVSWIFFMDGANKLIKHPGFFNSIFYKMRLDSPWFIRLLVLVLIISQISSIFLFDRMDFPA